MLGKLNQTYASSILRNGLRFSLTFYFSFRAKPKPSKKARLDRAAEEDVAPEHDQAPDHEVFTCEDIPNDPPLQDDVIPEEGLIHTPASADPPASSVQIEKSHTPADKPAAPTQVGESKDDDVVITGVGRSEPGNPATLTRHTIKEDSSPLNKGKWDVELETYAALNAQDLHSGYLNRLYTSCDCEAGLVKMMRDKFEVNSIFLFCHCIHPSSPQGPVCDFGQTGT